MYMACGPFIKRNVCAIFICRSKSPFRRGPIWKRRPFSGEGSSFSENPTAIYNVYVWRGFFLRSDLRFAEKMIDILVWTGSMLRSPAAINHKGCIYYRARFSDRKTYTFNFRRLCIFVRRSFAFYRGVFMLFFLVVKYSIFFGFISIAFYEMSESYGFVLAIRVCGFFYILLNIGFLWII